MTIRLDHPPGGAGDFLFVATIMVAGPMLLGPPVSRTREAQPGVGGQGRGRRGRPRGPGGRAVAAERARIAGELHHLVSDALASMVARRRPPSGSRTPGPTTPSCAFAAVEHTGREALGEIRALLGVLRREDEELAFAPQPSLAHIADLVARVRAEGLPVELDVDGEHRAAPGRRRPHRLSRRPGGARRRAAGPRRAQRCRASALLRRPARRRGHRRRRRRTDGERALLGMHERVALYGGELVVEPVAGSGYAVRARLPLEIA